MEYRFGEYALDEERIELRRGPEVVHVEPQVFDVLRHLVRHRDRVVAKEELLDEVWGTRFVTESTLTSRIKAARRAIGDGGRTQELIRTVRGRGFRFVAEVEEAGAPGAAPRPATPSRAAPVRYARRGSLNIAYQVTGDGDCDIVLVPGFVSHLTLDWADASHAHFLTRLGSFGRLIRFDKRGTGLSDRPPEAPPALETRMSDVRAVMDSAASERAVLFGCSEGGPMSVLFAATHPERTAGLVLYGTYARRTYSPDYPWAITAEERACYAERLERDWGYETDMQRMCPSADEATARWWGERCRAAASPGAARALIEMNSQVDVRDVLPAVHVPALVLHRTGDRDSRVEEGRYVAGRIPGARFVELAGVDHFVSIDPDQILDPVGAFLADLRAPAAGRSVLATIVAAHPADPAARPALETLVGAALARHGGAPARPSSAAVVGTLDGPGRAIRSAGEIAAAAAADGLRVGVGVHTAEVRSVDGRLEGAGMEAAAAIAAVAQPGAVVVSDTVAGLVSGSEVELAEWRVFPGIHARPLHRVA